MQPRLTAQIRVAASRGTTSTALRPDGKRSSTVSIHGGRDSGARFWKNASRSAPFTKRLSTIGRPAMPAIAPSATLR